MSAGKGTLSRADAEEDANDDSEDPKAENDEVASVPSAGVRSSSALPDEAEEELTADGSSSDVSQEDAFQEEESHADELHEDASPVSSLAASGSADAALGAESALSAAALGTAGVSAGPDVARRYAASSGDNSATGATGASITGFGLVGSDPGSLDARGEREPPAGEELAGRDDPAEDADPPGVDDAPLPLATADFGSVSESTSSAATIKGGFADRPASPTPSSSVPTGAP